MLRALVAAVAIILVSVSVGTAQERQSPSDDVMERLEALEHDFQQLFEQYMLLKMRPFIEGDQLRIPLRTVPSARSRAMGQYSMDMAMAREALWFLEWYLDTVPGGGGVGASPDFQNCTAECRRNNCRGLSGQEWVDCAVACDRQCR